MSVRLLRSEKTLTLENLLTPVKKLKRMWASQSFTTPYTPRRKSRLSAASAGSPRASAMGRSYSSTSSTTRRSSRPWRVSITSVRRPSGVVRDATMPAALSRPASLSLKFASSRPGLLKLPAAKLSRITGWRASQSQCSWMASPRNSGSLASNNSFSVSTNRLLPKRRGRDRK